MKRPETKQPDEKRPNVWDRSWILALGCALLAGCIFAAYHNTFRVPFLLDDDDSISKNLTLRSFSTALTPPTNSGVTVSGRPLLNLSLAINYRLGGTHLTGYHVGNLLIHFAAALSLFGVVRRTLKRPQFAARFGAHATPLAWFASALWALHPMQAESVTYIIQRAESLVGLCYLFTLYAFIRAVEKPSRMWTAITVVACLLGMAAKEVMATAPLVLFLYDRTFVSGTFAESWRRHRWLHVCLAASWVLLGALLVASGGRGSSVGFTRISSFDYALTQTSAIVRYLRLAFWPNDLVFDYGPTMEKITSVLVRSTSILVPLLAATSIALKKRPVWGFLGATFFLILAPSSSVVAVMTQTIAEHRMYLSLAALVVGVTFLIYQLSRKYCWIVFVALAAALAVTTVNRNLAYQSQLSIWEDTVRKMPDNIRALNNLGVVYLDDKRYDDAVNVLTAALDLVPNFSIACCNLGRAYIFQSVLAGGMDKSSDDLVEGIDFGSQRKSVDALAADPRVKEGLALLDKAVRADPTNANYAALYGNALLALREPEAALLQLEKAAELEPDNRDAHFDLANAFARLDRNEKAAEQFKISLHLKPEDTDALINYGALLRRMNHLPESIDRLEAALRLDPKAARAHSNLGVSLLQSGRSADGITHLEEALRLNPNLPQARYNLSNALADAGRTEEAIVHLEALLKIAPVTAELLSNLGVLYARVGRLEDAVTQTRRALELNPNDDAAKENLEKITAYIRNHPDR